MITKELENGKFHVYFKRSKEQLEFGEDQLRLHREWINGSWKPPLEEDEQVEEVSSFGYFLFLCVFINLFGCWNRKYKVKMMKMQEIMIFDLFLGVYTCLECL